MLGAWLKTQQGLLTKRFNDCFGVSPIIDSQVDIESWFASPLGQRVLQQQQQYLDHLLEDMFGYHLMQLSVINNVCLFSQSPTSHQFRVNAKIPENLSDREVADSQNSKTSNINAVAAFENLPIDSDSIDVALLHHALDYSPTPHQLLREAARVIIPNGHIILVGFNPHSFFGVTHPLACFLSNSRAYRHHHLRIGRLQDWFKVLELELVYSQRGYYGLPVDRHHFPILESVAQKICPSLGGFYILVVRKNVTPMTMIKTQWKKKRVLPKWRTSTVSSSSRESSSRYHQHSNSQQS